MDQLKSEVEISSALLLDAVCSGAHHELLIRGYSRRTVNRYMLVWQHLAKSRHRVVPYSARYSSAAAAEVGNAITRYGRPNIGQSAAFVQELERTEAHLRFRPL